LKAEIIVSLRPQVPGIATSGVSCSPSEIIEAARTYNALIAFDSDHKTNPAVCRQLARLIAAREQDAAGRNLLTTTRIVFWEGYNGIDQAAEVNVTFATLSIPEWLSTLASEPLEESKKSTWKSATTPVAILTLRRTGKDRKRKAEKKVRGIDLKRP